MFIPCGNWLENEMKTVTPADFNMTVANIPVNLAWSVANDPISRDHLVLFALGPDMHANAVLLERKGK